MQDPPAAADATAKSETAAESEAASASNDDDTDQAAAADDNAAGTPPVTPAAEYVTADVTPLLPADDATVDSGDEGTVQVPAHQQSTVTSSVTPAAVTDAALPVAKYASGLNWSALVLYMDLTGNGF